MAARIQWSANEMPFALHRIREESFIIMADGSVRYTQDRLPVDLIKPLVTRNGGESIRAW